MKKLTSIIVIVAMAISILGANIVAPITAHSAGSVKPMVSSGAWYTVALKNDGTVWAWGINWSGQLGDGTTDSRTTPVNVSGLFGVTQVSAGSEHTVALKSDGTVWAWGDNRYGQIGDGTTTDRLAPVKVSGLTGIIQVSAGSDHTVALKSDGTVWAWGDNRYGQIGDGTRIDRTTPLKVSGLTGITQVSGGYHTVALKSDGTLWAWGANWYGQIGDGTTTNRLSPVNVSGLFGVTQVSAEYGHTVALKSDGTVWVWGDNEYGQIGDGTTTYRLSPVKVSGLTGITQVSGGYHTVALKSDGTLWAWGRNNSGELGDGTHIDRTTPVKVSGLFGVTQVSGGNCFTVALKNDGTLWAWGDNQFGQLGDGTTTYRTTPVQALIKFVAHNTSTVQQPTTNITLSIFQNKNDMTKDTDDYILSSGATVNVGGTNYPVNSYGNATIPTGKDITISKADYISQTILASELTNSNKVYLEKSGGNMPIVKGVTLNGKHLRVEGASVSGDGNIKVDIDWNGNTAKAISIKQGTTVIPVSNGQTGNVALGTLLKVSGDVFVVAEATNGRITQKKLQLSVISATNIPKIPEGINFGNSVSGQSSDIPLIGKMDFKFEIPKSAMPISFSIDYEKKKIIGTIGFQSKGEILAQEDYDILKNVYKSHRSNNQSIRDSLKKALGTAKNNKLALPQSVPWGIDMKVFVGGYFEATWDESGNIKYTDTRIEGELSAGVKYNYPFVVLGVPAFLEAYLKGEIGFNGSIYGVLSTSGAFLPETKVEGEVAIGASLNAGLSGVLSVGGGGEGALKYTGVFVPLQNSTHKMEVTLKAFIQAQVLLLKWDYTLKKWGPYTVWQNPSGRSMSLMNTSYENIYSSMYDKSNYSIQDRSYINEPSEFVANGNLNTRMIMSMALFGATPSNKIESTIKTNVYPNSMPQLIDLGSGKQLLVWVDDDINRTSTNRTSLYYSLYNGSWSTPQAVNNDGTADFSPQLKTINGTTYLVWQNAKTTFSDTVTLEQMAQNLEIYVAKYNNANNTFDEINNVSNNSYLDMLPTIYGDGSEVSIVWASNTLNDIFGQNTSNQIMKSNLSGTIWSTPTTIVSGLKLIDSLAAGKKDVDSIIAYSVEMDGDMQTMNDKEIYINKNGSSSRLTTNEIIDSKPYFADDDKLYWYSGGNINYIDDFYTNEVNSILSDETVIPTDRFVVTTNANSDTAVLFEQANGLKADFHTFIYDKTLNKWSKNVALTELNSFINGFSGFIASDGQMKLAFNKQAIIAEMGEANPYGRADLCTLSVSPSYKLSIEGNLYYDPDMLVVGNGLEINTTVKNNGELTVNSVLLEVLDQNDSVLQSTEVSEPIVPGETKEYNAIYTIPENFNGKDIKVRITPVGSEDHDLLDNVKQASLDCIDASLEDVYLGKTDDGKDVLYAHIVNRGIKDTGAFTLKLVDGTADGTVIATKQATSLTPLAATVESFEYTNQDVFKTKTLYVVIEDLVNESFVGNNSDFVVLEGLKVLNMTVSNVEIVSQNEDSTGLKLKIDMEKNAVETLSGEFILAAYTESGKLLSITKAPVSISNTTDTLIRNINVPVKSDENILFKLFVWSSLGQMEPLANFCKYLYEPVRSVEINMVLESEHPHTNNMNETKTYTYNGTCQSIDVTFSDDTKTESGYDYIWIYDGNDNEIGQYDGTSLAGKTISIQGNTINIKLTSDGSVTEYGYKTSKIIANK